MRILNLALLLMAASLLLISCKKKTTPINETDQLKVAATFNSNGYKIELFNASGKFTVGYNKIYLRLTDGEGQHVENASISWQPMMTMTMNGSTHQHSCPYSAVAKAAGKQTLFEGYIVFNMASNGPDNYWKLNLDMTVGNQNIVIAETVEVLPSETTYHKVFTTGVGTDGKMYLLAMIEPSAPKIGVNDMVVGLFQKNQDGTFPKAEGYKLKVDPRMPGMGNHSAPGNEDLVQGADGFYHGKVGFSMTGYWKINLILEDASGAVIKGEPIDAQHEESSLHFKLEF